MGHILVGIHFQLKLIPFFLRKWSFQSNSTKLERLKEYQFETAAKLFHFLRLNIKLYITSAECIFIELLFNCFLAIICYLTHISMAELIKDELKFISMVKHVGKESFDHDTRSQYFVSYF